MLCAPDGPGSPGPFAAALYAAASEPAGFRNRAAVRRKESFGPAGRIPAGLGTGVGGAAADCAGGNPDGGSLFPGPSPVGSAGLPVGGGRRFRFGNPAEDPGRLRNGDLPPGLSGVGSCPHPGPGLLRPGGGMRGGGALRCTCPGLPQPGRPAGDPGGRPAGEPVSDGPGPDRRPFLYRRADDPADHRDRLASGGKNLSKMERRVRGGTRHRTQDGY